MKVGDVPGLSVALIREGRIYWHRGFGVKNANSKEPVDDATVFEAASLSKPVFAYAVLKLVDAGRLDLDKPLATYLAEPYLKNDDRSNLITARMVLTHTTGFQNEATSSSPLRIYFAPGLRFSYSGEGFLYLQRVIEQITGQPLDLFMERTVFLPLGMRSSSFVWQEKYEQLKATGHKASGVVAERRRPAVPRAPSSLHTTAVDYGRFVIAVMKGTGLKIDTAQQMIQSQVSLNQTCISCLDRSSGPESRNLSWGLGWGLERSQRGKAIWHWGENNGEFQNFVMAYPKEKLAIVVLTNSGNGLSIIPAIVVRAIGGNHAAFAWMGYESYNSPAKVLFRTILVRGVAAIQAYRTSRRQDRGILSESQVNSIGYWLLGKKRVNEAIEIFKLNVENFPQSSNAYDSLGEAYMISGNRELSLRSYERSVQLDPRNTNAIEMIKKLKNK